MGNTIRYRKNEHGDYCRNVWSTEKCINDHPVCKMLTQMYRGPLGWHWYVEINVMLPGCVQHMTYTEGNGADTLACAREDVDGAAWEAERIAQDWASGYVAAGIIDADAIPDMIGRVYDRLFMKPSDKDGRA